MKRQPRPRPCDACGEPFTPRIMGQKACSPGCAIRLVRESPEIMAKVIARATRAQRALQRKAEKALRAQRRADKERIMRRSDWIKKVDRVFNPYIRLRDRDLPCISCGRSNAEVEVTDGWKPGGAWDCGHYLGKGAYPNLRYEPDNAHKQCKSCNGGSNHYAGKRRTVSESYEARLIERIGADRVEELKADQTPRKYTIDDLKALHAHYSARLKSAATTVRRLD